MQTSPKPVAALLAGRLARRAVSWLLCALILAAGAGAGTARANAAEPAPPSSTETVKYYIVGHTGTAEREYLFQIAARTLGDGRRYMEIFELNKGRLQPDGARLEDPYVLMPGWILVLPADADGPGVVIGPPPVFGSGSAESPTSPAAAPPADSGDDVIRAVALVLVTVILGTALHLLRRGRRIELPALARAGTSVEPEHAIHEPAVDRPDPAGRGSPPAQAAPVDRPATERPATDRRTTERAPTERAPADQRTTDRPATDRPATDRPAGEERRRLFDRPAGAADQPATSTRQTEPMATRVEVSLPAGPDRLMIRLIGARPGGGDAILGRGEARPQRSGGAVVRLGDAGPDTLWIDLAASPDVVRIAGNPAGVHRQCEAIARQLSRAGVSTVVVGDVPGVTALASRAVASPSQVIDSTVTAQLLVAFLTDPAPAEVAALHDLVTRRRPRVVPVVVGGGPRSRWSIDVA